MTRTFPTALAAFLLLLGFSIYVQFSAGIAWDKDWLFYCAGMWLQGKKLYVDIIEPNPPLIIWLYSAPVFLASLTGMSDAHALAAFGTAIAAGSAYLCLRLTAFHSGLNLDAHKRAGIALLLCFIFYFNVSPASFADRDDLFIVLAFPYVLRFMPGIRQVPLSPLLRVLIGCIAAIGFCMKPQCFSVFAGVQIVCMMQEKKPGILVSAENITLYAVSLLYLLLIVLLAPEYVHTIWPMVMQTYLSMGGRIIGIFINLPLIIVTLGICCAEFRPRDRSPLHGDIYYLLGICLFCFLYALIGNGWGYTYLPLASMVFFTCGWLWLQYAGLKKEQGEQGLPVKRFISGMRACVAVFAFNVFLITAGMFKTSDFHCEESSACGRDHAIIREIQKGNAKSFGIFSLNFLPWPYYRIASGAEWKMRVNCFWMLTKFMGIAPAFAQGHQWILDYMEHAMAQDLNTRKPTVLFNDVSPVFLVAGRYIYITTLLSKYPDFNEAWAHYRFEGTINFCKSEGGNLASVTRPASEGSCKYDVYRRKD